MTDQVKRALELVDFWRNWYLKNDAVYSAINELPAKNLKTGARVIDFFLDIINEVKLDLADANTIKSLIGIHMNKILNYSDFIQDEEIFIEIKNFLR